MQQIFEEQKKIAPANPRASAGIKALLLDDSVFDRRRIRRLSDDTHLPISLDEISSIDALDQVLAQDRFDVILLDYNLPSGDGIEALKRIRGNALNSECPAIMVTGDNKPDIAIRSLKMGCSDYLSKDQLSAQTLKESIVGAISKVSEKRGSARLLDADIEQMTASIMAKYTNALQPKLARVIREMRALRSSLGDPDKNVPGDLEKIERQCVQMWAVLLDPKIVSGTQEFRH